MTWDAMYRHKTKHFSFKYGLPILALLDLFIYILSCLAECHNRQV